jgi:hemerythrin-like domain-containing protein
MNATSPIEELQKDHEILNRDLQGLAATVGALGDSAEALQEVLNGSLRGRMAYFLAGMQLHFRREEEGLFPDAKRMVSEGQSGPDIIVQFFGEEAEDDLNAHAVLSMRMEEMMAILEDAETAGGLDEQARRRLRTLIGLAKGLLERHAAKEDKLIFPMIERALTPAQLDAVLERMAAIQPQQDASDPRMRQVDDLGGLSSAHE